MPDKNFYDLSVEERGKLTKQLSEEVKSDVEDGLFKNVLKYAADKDTYIRKQTYLFLGRLYTSQLQLQSKILKLLTDFYQNKDEKIRQTAINALGEIGIKEADKVLPLFEKAILDEAHEVRNAVIGSLKKMGEKNPQPVIEFVAKFLTHPNPEVRRQILHGIELRGRTHPEDILPLLEKVQNEQNKRVRDTVIHVLGQISYKKGCLEKVVSALRTWNNKQLVVSATAEILETHKAYEKFSAKSYLEAQWYLKENLANNFKN